MRYASVCSGIEAVSVAWRPLGWRCVFTAENDAFPSDVLAHHFPSVPNMGDITKFDEWPQTTFDVLVGGTPCQSFSVAGLRGGLDDQRGNLMLTFVAIARKYRPRWVVWENVPGVLSSNGGTDFASLLGILTGRAVTVPAGGWQNSGITPGISSAYGLTWRVLDAQYFGVPQRRRRVFVVGYLGNWHRAAAVLFERQSLRGDSAPRREAGKRVAGPIAGCSNGGGANGPGRTADDADSVVLSADVAKAVRTPTGGIDREDMHTLVTQGVANPLTARMHKGINSTMDEGQTMVGVLPFDTTQATHPANHSAPKAGDPCHPLAGEGHPPAIAFSCKDSGDDARVEVAPTLRSLNNIDSNDSGGGQVAVAFNNTGHGFWNEGDEVAGSVPARADGMAGTAIGIDEEQNATHEVMGTLKSHQSGGFEGAVAFESRFTRNGRGAPEEIAPPLKAQSGSSGKGDAAPLVAFKASHFTRGKDGAPSEITPPLSADADKGDQDLLVGFAEIADPVAANQARTYTREGTHNFRVSNVALGAMQVRRLTPRECERLQGFPDDYTLITYRKKPAADGPRYKALGNSMAVPVMRWIAERIELVDAIEDPK